MVYLGSITTEDGKSEVEIKRRIEIGRNAFNNMKSVLSSRNISMNTRMRLTKYYVLSTLLYGAETWTITKTLTKRIDAFEMWTYRQMLRISWKEHKSNEEGLEVLFKGTNNIKSLLMHPKDPIPDAQKTDIIYHWKCPANNCTAEYIDETNRSLKKKEFQTIEIKPPVPSETTTSPQNTQKQNLKILQFYRESNTLHH